MVDLVSYYMFPFFFVFFPFAVTPVERYRPFLAPIARVNFNCDYFWWGGGRGGVSRWKVAGASARQRSKEVRPRMQKKNG